MVGDDGGLGTVTGASPALRAVEEAPLYPLGEEPPLDRFACLGGEGGEIGKGRLRHVLNLRGFA